tara:strand:- start:126 stop:836 length:711 start_codon:yes stop_codon:yes gene_type:complete
MRKDMDKLLVTTPRIGSSWKNREIKEARRSAREGAYDSLPGFSSMKPKSRKWDERKEFNEYLKPLVRYLKKNCGRPWDKVYSEICENMDRRGVVQDHIFQHLFQFVEVRPIFKNKKPHSTGYGGLSRLYKSGWTFYVDKAGTLREPKEKRPPWKEEERNSNLIKTDDDSVFLLKRSDGTWFRVSLEDWPQDADEYQILFAKGSEWVVEALGKNQVGSKKIVLKTLSKREKKTYGVK